MKNKLTLVYLYLFASAYLIIMYLTNTDMNILVYSLLFLIVILINRVSLQFLNKKSLFINYLYATEIFFLLYLVLILFYKEEYFIRYKLLIIPSIILSAFQVIGFKIVKVKK